MARNRGRQQRVDDELIMLKRESERAIHRENPRAPGVTMTRFSRVISDLMKKDQEFTQKLIERLKRRR